MPRPIPLLRLLACAVVMTTALAACGSKGSGATSTTSPGSAQTSGTAQTSGALSPANALTSAYQGVVSAPPTQPVAPPAGGGSVWVVSCGQSIPTCATPAEATATAAESAGLKATLCDGKLNPQGWSDCIRQGISAKSTGIVVIGQDCSSMQTALQEAKAAKIPVIGSGGNDCDVAGGTKLFAAIDTYLTGMTQQQWWSKMGALQADWIIGKTGGKAQVLSLKFTDALWGTWIQQGFTAELAKCSGCKVLQTLDVSNQDVSSGQLPQKFSTALLKDPTANAVNVPLDGWFLAGLAQAINSSGRSSQLNVIGNFGEPGNLDLIRKNGGEDATVGFSAEWSGWAGVDALLRVLAGKPIQAAGVGLQVVDAGHNLPAAGATFSYNPVIDFKAAYSKLWRG